MWVNLYALEGHINKKRKEAFQAGEITIVEMADKDLAKIEDIIALAIHYGMIK